MNNRIIFIYTFVILTGKRISAFFSLPSISISLSLMAINTIWLMAAIIVERKQIKKKMNAGLELISNAFSPSRWPALVLTKPVNAGKRQRWLHRPQHLSIDWGFCIFLPDEDPGSKTGFSLPLCSSDLVEGFHSMPCSTPSTPLCNKRLSSCRKWRPFPLEFAAAFMSPPAPSTMTLSDIVVSMYEVPGV